MKKIKPQILYKENKIGIISPSEPITSKKEFNAGIKTLKSLGLRVVLGKNVFKKYDVYMAGKDDERARDINEMFKNKEIKGIFCSIGGFNTNRLLDLIDYKAIVKNPKILFGYSDITVLLNAIYKKTGLVTFHGPNVLGFSKGLLGKNKYTHEYFIKALMNKKPIGKIKNWQEKIEILKKGKAIGDLIGGNLSALTTLIGTKYEPDWKNKILFLEEINQTAQDIDFLFTHLRLAGIFEKISGIVIGKFINCDMPLEYKKIRKKIVSLDKIILGLTQKYKFPIIKGVAFGHYYPQITIPIGVKATIDTSKNLPFSIDEAGVK